MMIILFHANFQGMEESISFTRRDMRDIGLKARKLMRDRVAKGKDINDSKFKKYSDGYAKYKKKLGKNPSIVDMMDSGTLNNGIRVNAMHKHKKSGGWIFKQCLPLCAMSPSSMMIHRTVFDDVGLFDENLPACEDYDLWLRITAKYPVLFLEQPLIKKFGGHEDQLSHKYWGMDRFRIQALGKIITQPGLSIENKQDAIKMLVKKAKIFRNGALKRDKIESAQLYQQLIDRYQD